jgi:hypothetical protein
LLQDGKLGSESAAPELHAQQHFPSELNNYWIQENLKNGNNFFFNFGVEYESSSQLQWLLMEPGT